MKLCPKCHSDSIERTSSTALRVVACIVLLFIPFGLLFCWIPFVFPHSYQCSNCGKNLKEEELVEMDWREKEALLEKYKLLEEKLRLLMGRWFLDDKGSLCKVAKGRGQLLLIKVMEYSLDAFRIVNYDSGLPTARLVVNDNIKLELTGPTGISIKQDLYDLRDNTAKGSTKEENIRELTPVGQEVLTEEEFTFIEEEGIEAMTAWLREKSKMIEENIIVDLEA